jgi:hypothetical protein
MSQGLCSSCLEFAPFKNAKAVPLHAMKALGGGRDIAPTHSRPRHYMGWVVNVTPRPRFNPGTHWTGGWVGPRAGLDTEATRKLLSPLPGNEPRSPGRRARSQALTELPGSPCSLSIYKYENKSSYVIFYPALALILVTNMIIWRYRTGRRTYAWCMAH